MPRKNSRITRIFVETCQWKAWVLGQLLLVMGGGGKNREFEYAKKNGLSTIHSTFKFTPSTLKLKIARYSQYVNLCWSLHSPIVLVFLGILFRDSRSRSHPLNTYTSHFGRRFSKDTNREYHCPSPYIVSPKSIMDPIQRKEVRKKGNTSLQISLSLRVVSEIANRQGRTTTTCFTTATWFHYPTLSIRVPLSNPCLWDDIQSTGTIPHERPVPEKMRLEMVNKMQIEFLNGGEILVNYKFKLKSKSQFEFVLQDTEEFKSNQNLNPHLYCEIPRKLSFSILTSWLKFPHHSGFRLHFFDHFESYM